jgi:hypothetical protein
MKAGVGFILKEILKQVQDDNVEQLYHRNKQRTQTSLLQRSFLPCRVILQQVQDDNVEQLYHRNKQRTQTSLLQRSFPPCRVILNLFQDLNKSRENYT